VSRERENRERGSRGLMGKGLKGLGRYWGSNRWQFPKPERERREIGGEEGADMRVPPDSERGRESVGLGWLGWCGAAAWLWAPGAAQLGWFLLFFCSDSFLFSIFLFIL
jgi:hypothetical protein